MIIQANLTILLAVLLIIVSIFSLFDFYDRDTLYTEDDEYLTINGNSSTFTDLCTYNTEIRDYTNPMGFFTIVCDGITQTDNITFRSVDSLGNVIGKEVFKALSTLVKVPFNSKNNAPSVKVQYKNSLGENTTISVKKIEIMIS